MRLTPRPTYKFFYDRYQNEFKSTNPQTEMSHMRCTSIIFRFLERFLNIYTFQLQPYCYRNARVLQTENETARMVIQVVLAHSDTA